MQRIRYYKRYHASGEGELRFSHSAKRYSFKVLDASAAGLRIASEIELEEKECIRLRFVLAGPLSQYVKEVDARVMKKEHQGSVYQYGLHFLHFTHMDVVELDEYLRINFGTEALVTSPLEHVEHLETH